MTKIYIGSAQALNSLLEVFGGQALYGTVSGNTSADGTGDEVMISVSLPGSYQTGQFQLVTLEDLKEVEGLYSDITTGTGDDSSYANIGDLQIGVIAGLIKQGGAQ
jgi:hypothetical protein